MTRTLLRLLAATLAAGVALLIGAAPASAHTRLQGSDPVDGSSIATAPDRVSLTFNEDIQADFAVLTVVGPDGTEYQSGPVSAGGGQVSTTVSPLGPAGPYQVGYRVVSDDGHPVQGKVSFTLTTPGPGAGAPAPAARPTAAPAPAAAPVEPQADTQAAGTPDTGTPVWPWLAAAVLLVAGGAAAALRLGRTGR